MDPISHPGRLLKRELEARRLSANRLALDLGVPSGRITDILNGRRSITADTALRLGRYFGNSPRFWLDLQSQYDLAMLERERGDEIFRQVHPAGATIVAAISPYSEGVLAPPDQPFAYNLSRGRTGPPSKS